MSDAKGWAFEQKQGEKHGPGTGYNRRKGREAGEALMGVMGASGKGSAEVGASSGSWWG